MNLTRVQGSAGDPDFETGGIDSNNRDNQGEKEDEGKHTGSHPEDKTCNKRRRKGILLRCLLSCSPICSWIKRAELHHCSAPSLKD